MDKVLSIVPLWNGWFDTTNVYQLTSLRHELPTEFLTLSYPVHRNTGIYIHDTIMNRDNERLLDSIVHSNLSLEEQRDIFRAYYQEPPLSIDIRYRHGYKCI